MPDRINIFGTPVFPTMKCCFNYKDTSIIFLRNVF